MAYEALLIPDDLKHPPAVVQVTHPDDLRRMLGCRMLERVHANPAADNLDLIVDEEGMDRPYNLIASSILNAAYGRDDAVISGPAILAGVETKTGQWTTVPAVWRYRRWAVQVQSSLLPAHAWDPADLLEHETIGRGPMPVS